MERLQSLSRFLDVRESDMTDGLVVDRGPVTEVERVELDDSDQIFSVTTQSSSPRLIPGTTLIVGDSQMAFLIPALSSYFEEIVFLNWLTFELNPATKIPAADRVLIETIEQDESERFSSETMNRLLEEFG